jgi:hypothetical protein
MPSATVPSKRPSVFWLIESRPSSLTWARPSPPQRNQPQLDLTDQEPVYAEAAAAKDRGIRMSTVKARWAARPRPGLPDAQEWSAKLALAITQTLTGQRPAAQATRRKCALAMVRTKSCLNLRRRPSDLDTLAVPQRLQPSNLARTCGTKVCDLKLVDAALGVAILPTSRRSFRPLRGAQDYRCDCLISALLEVGDGGRNSARVQPAGVARVRSVRRGDAPGRAGRAGSDRQPPWQRTGAPGDRASRGRCRRCGPAFVSDGRSRRAVYNCANPPYHRWLSDWPRLASALLAASEPTEALLAPRQQPVRLRPGSGRAAHVLAVDDSGELRELIQLRLLGAPVATGAPVGGRGPTGAFACGRVGDAPGDGTLLATPKIRPFFPSSSTLPPEARSMASGSISLRATGGALWTGT